MKANDYIDVDPEQWYVIDTTKRWIKLKCCDCGLVHDIYINVLDHKHIAFNIVGEGEENAGKNH